MVKYFASFLGVSKVGGNGWSIIKTEVLQSNISNDCYRAYGLTIEKSKCFDTLEDCINSVSEIRERVVYINCTIIQNKNTIKRVFACENGRIYMNIINDADMLVINKIGKYKYTFLKVEEGEEIVYYDCKPDDIMSILKDGVVLTKVEKIII